MVRIARLHHRPLYEPTKATVTIVRVAKRQIDDLNVSSNCQVATGSHCRTRWRSIANTGESSSIPTGLRVCPVHISSATDLPVVFRSAAKSSRGARSGRTVAVRTTSTF